MNRTFKSACLLSAVLLALSVSQPSPAQAQANRFAVAGIASATEVSAFLMDLQGAVAADERGAVASMVAYPLRVYASGALKTEYKDAAAFTAAYDSVITPAVKSAVAAAKSSTVTPSAKGVSIGDGKVWFNASGGFLKVTAVNP